MSSTEKEAILAAIDTENRAFWMRDVEAHDQVHLHSADMLLWGHRHGGGFVIRSGWEEISARTNDHVRRFPSPVPELAEAPISNLTLHVASGMAWASYDRHYPFVPRLGGFGPNGTLHNLRILEKHDGRWLIAVAGMLDPNLGEEVALRVAGDGNILWQSAAAAERLRNDEHFVARAGSIRGRNRQLDVRLQESIAWAIARDTQVMPYGGSMPLQFESRSGLPRTVWIVADLDAALVFLDDIRPIADRVDMAARAYGLSPAQARLLTAIAKGTDPTKYAQTTGISANTVRTHIKRMFEKVGVSSQAALVRAVMMLSPPR